MSSPTVCPYSTTEALSTDITAIGTVYTAGVSIPAQATKGVVSLRVTVPAGAVTASQIRVTVQTAVTGASAGSPTSWTSTDDVLLIAPTGENTYSLVLASPILDKCRLQIVTSQITGGGTLRFLPSWGADTLPIAL